MPVRIQLRRDTAANWTATNPTLTQGEPGYETDTGKIKYGDGTTAWNSLAYAPAAAIVDGTIVNGDINASAAIADTKLATISTAGKVSNSATTATNANTASAIVARDASGNFTAGTITASLSGNASTATTFETARTINGVSFNGSSNITVTANTPNTLTRGTYLTGTDFNGGAATTWAVDATSANTASKVVARDASGNFSAGTITANLTGTASNASAVAWSGVSGKPTTLSGFGITDAASSTHSHGNITNGGAIGSTSGLPIITGASGVLQAGSFGTTAGTFCQGNDSRLSNTRNTSNSVTFNNGGAGATSGQTFNGGSAVTVSYNTIGAPSTTGTNASGNWSISVSGNATTATTLQTARTINGVSFNGSANITVTANTPNTLTRGTYLTGSNFNGGGATTWAVDAASTNTASKVVARDASGNFSAGTITAALSGNANTATALQTARTIQGVSFNGTANITVVTAGAGISVSGTAVSITSTSNGFGTRTVSTSDPTGGTDGDIWLKV